MTRFQEAMITRGLRDIYGIEDEMMRPVNHCMGYTTILHWQQGYLEMGKNMSGILKGQELFTWHISIRHISYTFGM